MKSKLNYSPMIIFVAVLLVVTITSIVYAKEEKVSIQQSELPQVIKNAIEKEFPNGRILQIEKEVEGEDVIAIRPMCYISNTIDHRVIDGFQSNAFLAELVSTLENWS